MGRERARVDMHNRQTKEAIMRTRWLPPSLQNFRAEMLRRAVQSARQMNPNLAVFILFILTHRALHAQCAQCLQSVQAVQVLHYAMGLWPKGDIYVPNK